MAGKCELINTGTDERFMCRNDKGHFTKSDDVGRSLSKDVRQRARTSVKRGHGDGGDQKRK